MRRLITKQLLILLGCGLFMVSLNACSVNRGGIHVGGGGPVVKHGPPPHAPAHGHRAKHAYYYYPEVYVYFDISRKVYFFLEGDMWRMSVSLPHSLYVRLGDHVAIETHTDKPYTHFHSHKRKYPPGQLKKKKKWAKKKW